MDPSRSHRLVHVINNCEGPGQYNTNSNTFFLCFDLSFIKFLINTREKQELSGVEPGTSGLLAFGCPTEPSTPDLYIYIYIYICVCVCYEMKFTGISINVIYMYIKV